MLTEDFASSDMPERPAEGEEPQGRQNGSFPGGGIGSSDVKLQYADDDPDSYPNIFDNAKTALTDADKARLIAALKILGGEGNIEDAVDVEQVIRYLVVHGEPDVAAQGRGRAEGRHQTVDQKVLHAGVVLNDSALGYEAQLFAAGQVHTIDLRMEDWEGFLETCTNEEYQLCSLTIDGEAVESAAIRAKGNTSLTSVAAYGNDRYSFKVELRVVGSLQERRYYGVVKEAFDWFPCKNLRCWTNGTDSSNGSSVNGTDSSNGSSVNGTGSSQRIIVLRDRLQCRNCLCRQYCPHL